MHDFKIEMTGIGRGTVTMDGEEVKGVTAVSFSAAVDEMNKVTLTLNAKSVSISGMAELIAICQEHGEAEKASAD